MVYSDGRRTQNPAVLVYAHSATAGIMSWNPANIEPQHTDFSVYDITTQSDTDMTLDFENSTVTVRPTALAVTQIIATGGHFIRASPFWFTNHTIGIKYSRLTALNEHAPRFIDFVGQLENHNTQLTAEIWYQGLLE